jgi:hypothetical protein
MTCLSVCLSVCPTISIVGFPGMLLHSLDEQLLCHLLMSPPDLKRKVAEAVKVIGQYAPDK